MASIELTFDGLCEDILRQIFDKYLDFRSQLRVQSVCRRFRDIMDGLFDGRRALCLVEESKSLYEISDQKLNEYSVVSVEPLCQLKNGLWMRGEDGALRLLQPLNMQMLALNKHKHLTALCLVLTSRISLEALIYQILVNCSSNLEKLVVINLNSNHFYINIDEMVQLTHLYSNLIHFEIFTDYLVASEQCFNYLLKHCHRLQVFKLNARHVFSEHKEPLIAGNSRSVTYQSYHFNGSTFTDISGQLTTICASNPILTDSAIIQRLSRISNPLNVKDLSVERLSLKGMQSICDTFKSLESLSFSMDDVLEFESIEIRALIGCITQLEALKKLSIRWFSHYSQRSVPFDRNILKELKNCHQIKRFVIKEALISEDVLKAINDLIPSVESLHLVDCSLNITSFITIDEFNQLKDLVVFKSSFDRLYYKFEIKSMVGLKYPLISDKCLEMGFISRPQQPNNDQNNNEDQLIEQVIGVDHFPNVMLDNQFGNIFDILEIDGLQDDNFFDHFDDHNN